jgi:transposase
MPLMLVEDTDHWGGSPQVADAFFDQTARAFAALDAVMIVATQSDYTRLGGYQRVRDRLTAEVSLPRLPDVARGLDTVLTGRMRSAGVHTPLREVLDQRRQQIPPSLRPDGAIYDVFVVIAYLGWALGTTDLARHLGPAGRLALCQAIDGGMTFRQAAVAMSVSPATAHRWWRRYQDALPAERHSLAWTADRSSRPARSPRLLDPIAQERICEARQRTGWGPRLVAGATGHPHSTVWKVLQRHGLGQHEVVHFEAPRDRVSVGSGTRRNLMPHEPTLPACRCLGGLGPHAMGVVAERHVKLGAVAQGAVELVRVGRVRQRVQVGLHRLQQIFRRLIYGDSIAWLPMTTNSLWPVTFAAAPSM